MKILRTREVKGGMAVPLNSVPAFRRYIQQSGKTDRCTTDAMFENYQTIEEVKQNMEDAGYTGEEIDAFLPIWQSGNKAESLIR